MGQEKKKSKKKGGAKLNDPVKPAKPEPLFELTREQLRAVHGFVGKEPGRYALTNVQVDGEGVAATDGRKLIFVPHKEGQKTPAEPVMVQGVFVRKVASLFKPKAKPKPKKFNTPVGREKEKRQSEAWDATRPDYAKFFAEDFGVDGEADKLYARLDHVQAGEVVRVVEEGRAEGTFPNWRAVAMKDAKVHVALNAGYVLDAMKAMKEFTNPTRQSVLMSVKDRDSAVLFTAHNGATTLLMPVDYREGEEIPERNDFPNRPLLKAPAESPKKSYDEYCVEVLQEPLRRFLNDKVKPRTKIHKAAAALQRELDKRVEKLKKAKKGK